MPRPRMVAAPVIVVACAVTFIARTALAQATPAGLWNTISDTDGRTTALVEIREQHGELTGTVRGLLVPADPNDSGCGKCSGDRKGQRIVGMEILRHVHREGEEWGGGEILDPETGKVYRVKLKLADDGQKLIVRGYIGLSLFGRSQVWM